MYKNLKVILFLLLSFLLSGLHCFGSFSSRSENSDSIQYIPGDDEYNIVIAAWKGDYSVVDRLLSKGINANTTTDDGISPLMYASQMGHLKICKLLISKGADVNLRPQNGRTALMAAVKGNHIQIVDLLLKDSANINAIDEFKRTPLLLAAAFTDSTMCLKLIENKADINARDRSGANLFLAAIQNSNPNLALFLLKYNQDINSVDYDGVSAVMISTGNKDWATVDFLLKHGANINLVSKHKQSALTIAIEMRDELLVQKLIDNGADVNQKLSLAETPLTVARYVNADNFLIEELTSKGANQNAVPDFRRFSVGPELSWNLSDFMAGFSLGLKECKYNFDLSGGMLFRPFAVRILEHSSGNIYNQFWERRNYAYLALVKNINLLKNNTINQRGFFVGLRETYSYGSYRGSSLRPKDIFLTIPEAGLYQSSKYWQLAVSYLYSNFNTEGVSPHRISITFRVVFGGVFEFNQENYKSWD